jgi:putative transcriptional regulator
MLFSMLSPSGCSLAPGLTGARKFVAILLLGVLLTALLAIPALAGMEFSPSSVQKGVLLVASPTLNDPNFRQTVILIVEHGPQGTLGLVLNRSTNLLLSEALPDVTLLKGTGYRLFAGGPVEPSHMLILFQADEAPADARSVFDRVYVGGTVALLERIITEGRPTDTFRAFAGSAGWAPGQLGYEMRQGAWATLPPSSVNIFDKHPSTLWPDCVSRLQAPGIISN